ncbi:MAG: T9SS type A sorting domain-containing protein [Flavobacteriales bacterium]|nr:T9SS type A sorting domain-containing protein [Flavobacteriales bacterium]
MRSIVLFLSTLLYSALCAQSISGNLNAGTGSASLGYGNVDIYRGDKLVASVLTDRYGNFNVRLDTGLYRCVVSYDGYVSSTKTVRVKADEKVDFAVAKETGTPKGAALTNESKVMTTYSMADAAPDYGRHARTSGGEFAPANASWPGTFNSRTTGASEGVLTAGEVNDFAKWQQWTDLSAEALSGLRKAWGMAPNGRYTLALQTPQGLPLTDAHVRLVHGSDVLYQAHTDNTGKAELWASLDALDTSERERLQLHVEYGGRSFRVEDAQPFTRKVNRLVVDMPCGPSEAVDVAFLVDATGSMQDEIDFLKAEMNDIIYRSKRIGDQLSFRFANVFYRDAGTNDEYTTRSMDFTPVLSTAVNFISAQRADGGGDTPEAVEIALDSAINGLSWSTTARARILFFVLDAGPHLTPAVKQRMRELAAQAAAKGIRIVPVAASGTDKGTEYLMRSLALATNGSYTFLTDHSGVGRPHTAPSTDKFEVEKLNGLLVRILKSFTYMPDCQQQLPELALDYPDSTVQAPLSSDSTTAIPEGGPGQATLRWSYWPNPTSGLVNITADAEIPELYITDLSGKVLQVMKGLKDARTMQIDLSAYATGIYLIRYPYGSNWFSGKVVLQRS